MILGFDENGKSSSLGFENNSWEQIAGNSVKLISFYDMGVYDKSFKTAVFKF